MRVIAGTARGRALASPSGHTVRPTADRVRQATFNALESRDAVIGARVLDLFAGTGAMGIEALSRGAEHCTFVENNKAALAVIRTNLEILGFETRAMVIGNDVLRYLQQPVRAIDLALVDPPYTFEGWTAVLAALRNVELVVVETGSVFAPEGWVILRQQRYGGTVVTLTTPEETAA